MFKQIILPLIGVALFIILVGSLTQKDSPINLAKYISTPVPKTIKNVTINGKLIEVEIADNTASRAKGLSGRQSLSENSGMLFVFETKAVNPEFWMKDMLIPIDIIWIADGKIVKIDADVPKPNPRTADNKLPLYSAGRPVDYVLEVNSGFCANNNIKAGDSVSLPPAL